MEHPRSWHGRRLAGALLLALALGSLHAFSVLIAPLEAQLASKRADVSLLYSVALVSLTGAVLLSHRLVGRWPAGILAAGVGLAGAGGLALAATTDQLAVAVLGYGLLFGAADGLGYSLFLAEAGAALAGRGGLAIGLATAAYALGAMLFSLWLGGLADASGAGAPLLAMAATVLAAGLAAALLLPGRRAAGNGPAAAPAAGLAAAGLACGPGRRVAALTMRLWLIYALGAMGGLMAIGHAAGLVAAVGGSPLMLAGGGIAIMLGNAAGSIGGVLLAERVPQHLALAGAIGLGGLASLGLACSSTPAMVLACLAVAGLAYGSLIALVPAAVAALCPPALSGRVFGRVFTAWGVAGLAGPWLAGLVFDRAGGYPPALALAALFSAAGALAAGVRPLQAVPVEPKA